MYIYIYIYLKFISLTTVNFEDNVSVDRAHLLRFSSMFKY